MLFVQHFIRDRSSIPDKMELIISTDPITSPTIKTRIMKLLSCLKPPISIFLDPEDSGKILIDVVSLRKWVYSQKQKSSKKTDNFSSNLELEWTNVLVWENLLVESAEGHLL